LRDWTSVHFLAYLDVHDVLCEVSWTQEMIVKRQHTGLFSVLCPVTAYISLYFHKLF